MTTVSTGVRFLALLMGAKIEKQMHNLQFLVPRLTPNEERLIASLNVTKIHPQHS